MKTRKFTTADKVFITLSKLGGVAELPRLYELASENYKLTKTAVKRALSNDNRFVKMTSTIYRKHSLKKFVCPYCGCDMFRDFQEAFDLVEFENGHPNIVSTKVLGSVTPEDINCDECGEDMTPFGDLASLSEATEN